MSQIAAFRSLAGIWHHGILCRDGTVIHFTTDAGPAILSSKVASSSSTNTSAAGIRRTSYEQFQADSPAVYNVVYDKDKIKYSVEEIEARAESCIGKEGYNLFTNNCEHFAYWCATNEKNASFQRFLARWCAQGFAHNINTFGIVGGTIGAVIAFGIINSSPGICKIFSSAIFGFKLVERTGQPESSDWIE